MLRDKRRLVAVREDLAYQARLMSKDNTLYEFVNDAVKHAIEAKKMGVSLSEIFHVYKLLSNFKNVNSVILSESLLLKLLEHSVLADNLKNEAETSGFVYANLIGINNVERNLRMNLIRIFNIFFNGVRVIENPAQISVTMIDPDSTDKLQTLAAFFFEGFMRALGYSKTQLFKEKSVLYMSFRKDAFGEKTGSCR